MEECNPRRNRTRVRRILVGGVLFASLAVGALAVSLSGEPGETARALPRLSAGVVGVALAADPPVSSLPAPIWPAGNGFVPAADAKAAGAGTDAGPPQKEGTNATDPARTTVDISINDKTIRLEAPKQDGHGAARVRIEGPGVDREFESFGALVDQAPWLAAWILLIVALVFAAPVLMIALVLWYKVRRTRMINETLLKLAEKGAVPAATAMKMLGGGMGSFALENAQRSSTAAPGCDPAKATRRRAPWSDLRKGVVMGAIGLGLVVYSLLDDRSPNALGLVLLFLGAGYVALWYFEDRYLRETSASAPSSPRDASA